MNLLYRIFLIVCMATVAAACNRDAVCGEQTERRATVTIDCGGTFGVDVRTFIEGQLSNGELEIGWDEADRFRLWSFKSDGIPATSGVDFALYHYDMTFPVARFKGQVDLGAYNAGDTYNYYAVSPVPASEADVQGTRVSYTLPATQTGDFDGNLDILTAQLTDAPALAEDHNPDIRLQFQHQVHVLRITIPENQMGEDIRAMKLTFPEGVNVVGRLTVDATGASDPVLTDGSNVVKLNFAEPKKAGDVIYVTIAPTTIPAEGVISMRIIGRLGETSTDCRVEEKRKMAAGHFSPIELRVPTMKVHYTLLTFRLPGDLGTETLGERVNTVKITSSSGSLAGATLPDDSKLTSSELTYDISSAEVRDDGVYYTILLMPDVAKGIIDGLNGDIDVNKTLTATFESDSAYNLTNTVTYNKLELNDENLFKFSVPSLYVEDFSRIGDFNDEAETNAGSVAGMPEWSISRARSTEGSHVRLRPFYGWLAGRYQSRLDSCPIGEFEQTPGSGPVLKSSVSSISLYITFTAGAEKVQTPLQLGWTTTTGNIAASEGIEHVTGEETLRSGTDGSQRSCSFYVRNVGLNARLSWRTNITSGSWGTYSNTPIDNIVVKIVK